MPLPREELKSFPGRVEEARGELGRLIGECAWPGRIKLQVDDSWRLEVIES